MNVDVYLSISDSMIRLYIYYLSYYITAYTTYQAKLIVVLQDPVCSPKKLKCVENIEVPSSSSCLKSCSGFMVTSFVKSRENEDFKGFISKDIDDYNAYKINTKYPSGFEGN